MPASRSASFRASWKFRIFNSRSCAIIKARTADLIRDLITDLIRALISACISALHWVHHAQFTHAGLRLPTAVGLGHSGEGLPAFHFPHGGTTGEQEFYNVSAKFFHASDA